MKIQCLRSLPRGGGAQTLPNRHYLKLFCLDKKIISQANHQQQQQSHTNITGSDRCNTARVACTTLLRCY
jgi:hypothetical protein